MMGTVSNALKILHYFPDGAKDIGLSEISRLTGQNKATTYRYLCELESNCFVKQDPNTKGYRLGAAITDLARLSDPGTSILQILAQILEAVSDEASCWAFLYSAQQGPLVPLVVYNMGTPQEADFQEISAYSSPGVCLHAVSGNVLPNVARSNRSGSLWDESVSEFKAHGVAPSPHETGPAISYSAPVFDATGSFRYIITLARPRNPSKKSPMPLKSAVLLAARSGTAAFGGTHLSNGSQSKPKNTAPGAALHPRKL
ncbi:helix-turn-helix domain-containing protein [Leisingera aquimarina]|uniref:helix-turn-helix domain-containing protein n=1 Tax=Leisingera aquimarina TaxID=476529 RepID=UPI000A00E09F|nr:helix-turn-helix domain-containing protein [Leisingera aquimarina]